MNWYKKESKLQMNITIIGVTNINSGESASSPDVDTHFDLKQLDPIAHQLANKSRCINWYFLPKTGALTYWGSDPNYKMFKEDVAKHLKQKYDIDQIQSAKDLLIDSPERKYIKLEKNIGWYKRAKGEEYPIAAAIRVSGKVFEGKSHLDAMLKAIKAKYVRRNKNGDLIDKDGNSLEYTHAVDLNLFLTNKGRLISRVESLDMGYGLYSEDIPENHKKDFSREHELV